MPTPYDNDFDRLLNELGQTPSALPSPDLLERIERNIHETQQRIIPLRKLYPLLAAAAVILLINTAVIFNRTSSLEVTQDYVTVETSLVNDYQLYE